jgi:hypothetical protein
MNDENGSDVKYRPIDEAQISLLEENKATVVNV